MEMGGFCFSVYCEVCTSTLYLKMSFTVSILQPKSVLNILKTRNPTKSLENCFAVIWWGPSNQQRSGDARGWQEHQ